MIHNFCINNFEGPLDLLLHLIRSSKMDIYDINIESITRQYLEFINNNKDLSMDDSSEYLVMAAELIHLKSKLLLNKDDDEDEDDESLSSPQLAKAVAAIARVATKAKVLLSVFIRIFLLKYVYYASLKV